MMMPISNMLQEKIFLEWSIKKATLIGWPYVFESLICCYQ